MIYCRGEPRLSLVNLLIYYPYFLAVLSRGLSDNINYRKVPKYSTVYHEIISGWFISTSSPELQAVKSRWRSSDAILNIENTLGMRLVTLLPRILAKFKIAGATNRGLFCHVKTLSPVFPTLFWEEII